MKRQKFSENALFEYAGARKFWLGMLQIIGAILFVSFIILYFSFFKGSNFAIVDLMANFISSIYTQISTGTLLGAAYTALFGGLFFIFLPTEVLFITMLKSNNPYMLLGVFLGGLSISYFVNYFIGLKFAKLVKHIITPAKFYKTKGVVNKWGNLAIFVFNVLPLPSQQLAAILGVFKYNKARFYTFFMAGQIVKYIAIIITVVYVL